MKALLIERPRDARLVEIPVPEPGPDEVLVRVGAVGICGSDIELLEGRRPAPYVRYPIVPGHEWSGLVERAGGDVRDIDTGDTIVAEGFRNCGMCARCREGTTNLCTAGYAETGFTHQGAFAEFLTVPARLVHRLPHDASLQGAALLEPAACVANGFLAADLRPGMSIAVVGAGTLGLLAVAIACRTSPARLALVGTRPDQLAVGACLGATETRAASTPAAEGEFDLVFEATNHPSGATEAVRLARRGGTVILEGISGMKTPAIDPDTLSLRHLRVQGIFGASSRAWSWVVDLFSQGLLDPIPLVTHRFSLEEYDDAFAALQDPGAQAIKVQVEP